MYIYLTVYLHVSTTNYIISHTHVSMEILCCFQEELTTQWSKAGFRFWSFLLPVFLKRFSFIIVNYVNVCFCVGMSRPQRSQKPQVSMFLELQVVVMNYMTWVLGIELGYSANSLSTPELSYLSSTNLAYFGCSLHHVALRLQWPVIHFLKTISLDEGSFCEYTPVSISRYVCLSDFICKHFKLLYWMR